MKITLDTPDRFIVQETSEGSVFFSLLLCCGGLFHITTGLSIFAWSSVAEGVVCLLIGLMITQFQEWRTRLVIDLNDDIITVVRTSFWWRKISTASASALISVTYDGNALTGYQIRLKLRWPFQQSEWCIPKQHSNLKNGRAVFRRLDLWLTQVRDAA